MKYVIIAGSRDFFDPSLVTRSMERLYPEGGPMIIVSGGARGADKLGEWWAKKYTKVDPIIFEPNWRPNGVFDKSAGHKRNEKMGAFADEAVVFWDGRTPGSKDMIDIMHALEKTVHIIRFTTADDFVKSLFD